MRNDLPIVIFDGNCQGQHLAAILTAATIADCYFVGQDLGFVPSHLGQPCRYIDESGAIAFAQAAKKSGRLVIRGCQATPTTEPGELSYSALVDQTILFPHMQFYCVSPKDAQERFGPRATPRRVFEMDLGVIETCQRRAGTDIDFAGFIRQNAASRPLFHTALHPGGELTGMAASAFASRIPDADPVKIAQLEAYFSDAEGINSTTFHPIAQSVLAELGFDWGEKYDLYSLMLTQRERGEWVSLVQAEGRYREAFRTDSWCWLSLTQAYTALGRRADALDSLSHLLSMSPGAMLSWQIGLEAYLQFDEPRGIEALVHRADCFFKGQRMFSQIMAFFMLRLGRSAEAERHARDYYHRTPDRADPLVPLLLSLRALGQEDEVQQIMTYERAHASPARLAEICAVLGGNAELRSLSPINPES